MAHPLSSHFCYMQTKSITKTVTEESRKELLFHAFWHSKSKKTDSEQYARIPQIAIKYRTMKLTSRPICPMLSGVVAAAVAVTVATAPPIVGSATGMLMSYRNALTTIISQQLEELSVGETKTVISLLLSIIMFITRNTHTNCSIRFRCVCLQLSLHS
jgi:hypothetical protein